MTKNKIFMSAALAGAMVLGACTETGQFGGGQIGAGPNDPNRNTKNGTLVGAASGAVLGALVAGSGDRVEGALIGGAVGGLGGAAVGSSLDRQEADLRQALGARVVITNTGDRLIVTLPQDILFATNSTTLQPALIGDLQALAQNVQIYQNSTLQVIGHTDSDGEAAFNQQLSEGRAQSVANVLVQNGVPQFRIQAVGRGESQPVASNLTPQGKQQNRRVEIVILPNQS